MARNYDGVNQYSSIASTNYQSASSAITLAGWMRWDTTSAGGRWAIHRSSTGSFDGCWQLEFLSTGRVQPRIRFSTSGTTNFLSAALSPTVNDWMFVAYRWQASTGAWDLRVYAENGTVLDDTKSGTSATGETIDYTSPLDIEFGRQNTQYADITVGPTYIVSRSVSNAELDDLRGGGATALAVSDLVFAFDGDSTEDVQSATVSHFNSPTLVSGPGEGGGDVSVTVTAGESARAGVNPSVELGDLSVAPTQGSSARTGVDPSVALGSLSITPAVGSSARTGIDPTVTAGSGVPWSSGRTQANVTAVITKNFSTTEAIPAHFNMHAWGSTVTGQLSHAFFVWEVSGGSEHDGTYSGPNLGLVFETAGTFDVVLHIIDTSGNYGSASTTVTVGAKPTFDEEHYVNASTGNDTTGDGSSGSPWATLAKAITELETNKASDLDRRILLTAGQTHTITAAAAFSGYVGSVYIEKTGAGANPVIEGSSISGNEGFLLANGVGGAACRFRISDIDFNISSSGSASVSSKTRADQTNARGHDAVFVRCTMNPNSSGNVTLAVGKDVANPTHSGSGLPNNWGNFAVSGCTVNSSGYSFFGEPLWGTFHNTTFDAGQGPSGRGTTHVVRLPYSRYCSFRGCTFSHPNENRLAIKMHHDPASQDSATLRANAIFSGEHTIDGCTFDSTCTQVMVLGPQDGLASNSDERVRRVTISNNQCNDDPAYPVGTEGVQRRFVLLQGSQFAVVNNRLTNHYIETVTGQDETLDHVLIANNSIYWNYTSSAQGNPMLMDLQLESTTNATVLNNAVQTSGSFSELGMRVEGTSSGTVTVDRNFINGDLWWGNDGSSYYNAIADWQTATPYDDNSSESAAGFADPANGDFTIASDDPAYQAGTEVVAAIYSYGGQRRDPSSWDVGADAVDTIQTGSGGGVTATVSAGSSARTGVNPTASLGSLSIAASAGSSARTGVNPSIDFGSLSIAVAAGLSPRTGVNPIVQGGGSNVAALSATKSSIGVGVWL